MGVQQASARVLPGFHRCLGGQPDLMETDQEIRLGFDLARPGERRRDQHQDDQAREERLPERRVDPVGVRRGGNVCWTARKCQWETA